MVISFDKSRKELYSEYLHSDHWATLRAQKLCLTSGKCESCGSNQNIQVHHLKYREWYNCTVDDLIVLCRRCHDIFHEILTRNGTKPQFYNASETIRVIQGVFQRNSGTYDTDSERLKKKVRMIFEECSKDGFSRHSLKKASRRLRQLADNRS